MPRRLVLAANLIALWQCFESDQYRLDVLVRVEHAAKMKAPALALAVGLCFGADAGTF